MSMPVLGAKISTPSTSAEFALGTRHTAADGKQYIYVQAGTGGLSANQASFIDEAFSAVAMTTTNGTYGGLVGVPTVAIAASSYGWVQTVGNCSVNVGASAAADARLNTTATAGRLDDDATTGAKVIEGVKLNSANGGSAADTSAFLSNPRVGATL